MSLGEIVKTYVQEHKARHKWLKGVEFVERIPKSGTGKILRRVVRDWERELRRERGRGCSLDQAIIDMSSGVHCKMKVLVTCQKYKASSENLGS